MDDVRISHWITPVIRYLLLPALWVGAAVSLAGSCFLVALVGLQGVPVLSIVGAFAAALYLLVGRAGGATIVVKTSTGLIVSGRATEVPFAAIAMVTHVPLTLPAMSIVHLRSGEEIYFFPRRRDLVLVPSIPVARVIAGARKASKPGQVRLD